MFINIIHEIAIGAQFGKAFQNELLIIVRMLLGFNCFQIGGNDKAFNLVVNVWSCACNQMMHCS